MLYDPSFQEYRAPPPGLPLPQTDMFFNNAVMPPSVTKAESILRAYDEIQAKDLKSEASKVRRQRLSVNEPAGVEKILPRRPKYAFTVDELLQHDEKIRRLRDEHQAFAQDASKSGAVVNPDLFAYTEEKQFEAGNLQLMLQPDKNAYRPAKKIPKKRKTPQQTNYPAPTYCDPAYNSFPQQYPPQQYPPQYPTYTDPYNAYPPNSYPGYPANQQQEERKPGLLERLFKPKQRSPPYSQQNNFPTYNGNPYGNDGSSQRFDPYFPNDLVAPSSPYYSSGYQPPVNYGYQPPLNYGYESGFGYNNGYGY